MRFMRVIFVAGLAVAPAMAGAYTSSEGHGYSVSCNSNGYVLTSDRPVTRKIGAQTVTGIEKIYLGKSCDAYSKTFGEGSWSWSNAGFGVDFPNYSIGFPRGELFCPNGQTGPADGQACRL